MGTEGPFPGNEAAGA